MKRVYTVRINLGASSDTGVNGKLTDGILGYFAWARIRGPVREAVIVSRADGSAFTQEDRASLHAFTAGVLGCAGKNIGEYGSRVVFEYNA